MRYAVHIFRKGDDDYVGDFSLAEELTQQRFRAIFGYEAQDEAFGQWNIEASHVPLLIKFTDHVFDLDRFDYQVGAFGD